MHTLQTWTSLQPVCQAVEEDQARVTQVLLACVYEKWSVCRGASPLTPSLHQWQTCGRQSWCPCTQEQHCTISISGVKNSQEEGQRRRVGFFHYCPQSMVSAGKASGLKDGGKGVRTPHCQDAEGRGAGQCVENRGCMKACLHCRER